MRSRLARSCLVSVLFLALIEPGFGQESTRKTPRPKPPSHSPQKDPQKDPPEREETQITSDEQMRQAINHLTAEINSLGLEVQRLRKVTEHNASTLQLLLGEDRLSKLEDKIQDATDHKAKLDAREQEIQRRMRNIPSELIARGGLRRDEAEAAIKAELQRALDDVRNEQALNQQRIAELNTQAERLRAQVEMLRKKVDQADSKGEKQDE